MATTKRYGDLICDCGEMVESITAEYCPACGRNIWVEQMMR